MLRVCAPARFERKGFLTSLYIHLATSRCHNVKMSVHAVNAASSSKLGILSRYVSVWNIAHRSKRIVVLLLSPTGPSSLLNTSGTPCRQDASSGRSCLDKERMAHSYCVVSYSVHSKLVWPIAFKPLKPCADVQNQREFAHLLF